MTEYRRLKKIPANEYGDSGELDKYDTEKIESHGFDLVLYWYAYGSYEGSGEMLARRDGLGIAQRGGLIDGPAVRLGVVLVGVAVQVVGAGQRKAKAGSADPIGNVR